MNDIFLIGEVGFELTLQSVIDSIKETDENEPLNVHINSVGGNVFDGLAIYNFLKGLDREVNTFTSGIVASIASIIFLAGQNRSMNSNDNFLIHLPMGGNFGNAEDLEKTADQLRDIEDTLASIYALETNLTKHQAIELMKKDEFMEIDFLKEKGFINDIIKFKAVATFNKNTMEKAVTKQDVENIFTKFLNKFKNKTENKIIQDADGVEIEFRDLDSSDIPQVGDKALVDSKNAKGDFLLPDGTKYTFTNGELTAIKEAITVENLQAEIQDLKDEIVTSAENKVDKDKEITGLKSTIEDMKKEVIEIKNKITGDFNWDKKETKKDKDTQPKSRSLFKNK